MGSIKMPEEAEILLGYTICENSRRELILSLEKDTDAFVLMTSVPMVDLTFKIGRVDFSNYFRADSKVPIFEFAIHLKCALSELIGAPPESFAILRHMEGSGRLRISKVNETIVRVQKNAEVFAYAPFASLVLKAEVLAESFLRDLKADFPEYLDKMGTRSETNEEGPEDCQRFLYLLTASVEEISVFELPNLVKE